ncbi:MAG: hypothetical protein ACRDYA_18405, partial [Egibacteraceae bacterium]
RLHLLRDALVPGCVEANDFTTLRSVLADGVEFIGPLGHIDLTWFDLRATVASPGPVNGKIPRIRVTFDPPPITSRAGH